MRMVAFAVAATAVCAALSSYAKETWKWPDDLRDDGTYRLEGRAFEQAIPGRRKVTGRVAKTLVCGVVAALGGDPIRAYQAAFYAGERIIELDGRGNAVRAIPVTPGWISVFWRRHKDDPDIQRKGSTIYCTRTGEGPLRELDADAVRK